MNQTPAVYHWSGGLLCSFGLYLARKQSDILCLVNFKGLQESRYTAERIPIHILRSLADSLGIPLYTPTTSSGGFKIALQALITLVNQKYGVHSLVSNTFEQDSGIEALKQNYEEFSFDIKNLVLHKDPAELFSEALKLGFKAHILSVNEKSLNRSYLGAPLTIEMLQIFKEKNIHPFGANGEFETICTDGPNFKQHIPIGFGDVHFKNGFWYREIATI